MVSTQLSIMSLCGNFRLCTVPLSADTGLHGGRRRRRRRGSPTEERASCSVCWLPSGPPAAPHMGGPRALAARSALALRSLPRALVLPEASLNSDPRNPDGIREAFAGLGLARNSGTRLWRSWGPAPSLTIEGVGGFAMDRDMANATSGLLDAAGPLILRNDQTPRFAALCRVSQSSGPTTPLTAPEFVVFGEFTIRYSNRTVVVLRVYPQVAICATSSVSDCPLSGVADALLESFVGDARFLRML